MNSDIEIDQRKLPKIRDVHLERETTVSAWRIRRGLTEKQLGEICGTCQAVISNLTLGLVAPIYICGPKKGMVKPVAMAVASALGVPEDILFPRYICAIDGLENAHDADEILSHTVSTGTMRDAEAFGADRLIRKQLCEELVECIKHLLPPRHQKILIEYVVNESTLMQIGDEMRMTRENVRLILKKCLTKIRLNTKNFHAIHEYRIAHRAEIVRVKQSRKRKHAAAQQN